MLEYVGTFDLRQIDPELTGVGVTIASVCRSITYIDGQPQNDCRINTLHDCFTDGNVNFSNGINPDDGISEHATAIGAILIGSDPNGQMDPIGNFKYLWRRTTLCVSRRKHPDQREQRRLVW